MPPASPVRLIPEWCSYVTVPPMEQCSGWRLHWLRSTYAALRFCRRLRLHGTRVRPPGATRWTHAVAARLGPTCAGRPGRYHTTLHLHVQRSDVHGSLVPTHHHVLKQLTGLIAGGQFRRIGLPKFQSRSSVTIPSGLGAIPHSGDVTLPNNNDIAATMLSKRPSRGW